MAFNGTDRFELRAKIGEGGMGVVYDAYDRLRDMRVAVKTLRVVNASRLYQFKREFRALADLSHPNIIELHELFAAGDEWFLTMELVDGVDFITYSRIRGDGRIALSDTARAVDDPALGSAETSVPSRRSTGLENSPDPAGDPGDVEGPPALPPYRAAVTDLVDVDRLRHTLGQLASALHAVHAVGMVHRDLKPANVRVTAAGRVVLMDFGVVAVLGETGDSRAGSMAIGTPEYMAPEQIDGAPVSAAVDWYALGSVLYQAITGNLPYWWLRKGLLDAKRRFDPVPPGDLVTDVPRDLEQLCIRLLERDPDRRPDGDEILAALQVLGHTTARSRDSIEMKTDQFVGRAAEMGVLTRTHRVTRDGRARAVIIEGPSGMGKTSLVDRFVTTVLPAILGGPDDAVTDGASEPAGEPTSDSPGDDPLLVLPGRCLPQETLPYKAFDGVMDTLAGYLIKLSAPTRRRLLPHDVALVGQLFPALCRLPECRATPATLAGRNPAEVRALAMAAIRGLMTALACGRTVVIRIKDLQWADRDSLDLLVALLASPAPAGLLVLATIRSDEESPALTAALAEIDDLERLRLGPLAVHEQRELIARVAPGSPLLDQHALWRESGGHPMLLAEMARYSQRLTDQPVAVGQLALEAVIWRRITDLPAPARALMEVIAVAAESAPLAVLARAAGLPDGVRARASTVLRIEFLARVSTLAGEPWLDAYHDKVRETLVAHLDRARQQALHVQLARSLEIWGQGPATWLAHHWQAGGRPERCALYLLRAAREAAGKLASNKAAEFYREALCRLPDPPPGSSDDGAPSGGDDASWSGDVTPLQLARARCEAMLGLAEYMRVIDGTAEASELVDRALPVAEAHDLVEERARAHHLRGNLLFPRGDLDGCLAEHEKAQILARQAASPELEARAQSGLGDALYMRARMHSAHGHFARCIELCQRHYLTGIEAANLSMLGLTRYYQGDVIGGLRDCMDAAELAGRIRHSRAEIVARGGGLGMILLEMGDLAEARAHLEQAQEQCRSLGARRFEPLVLTFLAKIASLEGRVAEAEKLARAGVAVCEEAGVAFVGPVALGALALVARDPEERQRALDRAGELLEAGAPGHNHLYFYRDAIDVALQAGDPEQAGRYADALEDYTRGEPLGWSDFFIARGRALVAHQRGDEQSESLRGLLARARGHHLHTAARALEAALS